MWLYGSSEGGRSLPTVNLAETLCLVLASSIQWKGPWAGPSLGRKCPMPSCAGQVLHTAEPAQAAGR